MDLCGCGRFKRTAFCEISAKNMQLAASSDLSSFLSPRAADGSAEGAGHPSPQGGLLQRADVVLRRERELDRRDVRYAHANDAHPAVERTAACAS